VRETDIFAEKHRKAQNKPASLETGLSGCASRSRWRFKLVYLRLIRLIRRIPVQLAVTKCRKVIEASKLRG